MHPLGEFAQVPTEGYSHLSIKELSKQLSLRRDMFLSFGLNRFVGDEFFLYLPLSPPLLGEERYSIHSEPFFFFFFSFLKEEPRAEFLVGHIFLREFCS